MKKIFIRAQALTSLRRVRVSAVFIAAEAILFPVVALAQTPSPIVIPGGGVPQEIGGFYGLLCALSNWIFAFLLIIAVVMILFAALKFLTAGGNDEAVAGARKNLTFALVGVAVALLARSLVYVVGNFIAGTTGPAGLFAC